ncbi:SDR family oxidoreductase [Arenibaculum sp.]|jgi:NAD(P)-dependent dehydrogenase (short-subunit alcohol dehydrogenase family)|uniref:SDR family oxidoreductase n=1 Tax=Arenibaculum sp. TaxID=2865862 RepID=UPI002E10E58D|nr:SDR family oxidoreductase [Arenibaculum sp.]
MTGDGTLIVTGATGGVGAALARRAARDGWDVVLGWHARREAAEDLARSIAEASGRHTLAVRLPLDEPDGIEAGLDEVEALGRPVRALALCAAPAPEVGPFARASAGRFRAQFEAAVVGNHRLMAECWRRFFRRQGGGHVVAVLSAALGPPAAPHMVPYVAAKGALAALLEAAAAELGPAGLRVGAASPGYIETGMLSAFDARMLDRVRERSPGGRFLDADEVAAALADSLAAPPEPGRVHPIAIPEPVTT